MDTAKLFTPKYRRYAVLAVLICWAILLGATLLSWSVQRDFGGVEVRNVRYPASNGRQVRAKLLRPVEASPENPLPGAVYIHGYQNNRETSDGYCIEMARRGFVMLCIDALGRGNSDNPGKLDNPDFDPSFGGSASLAYLEALPYVDAEKVGLMGHSLGAEMVYAIALSDPSVKALVISGFAYREDASADLPRNMLMIFGKYDEYRQRMTGTDDFEADWMDSPQTAVAIPVPNPQLGRTYGDFELGSARQVFMVRGIHIQESHSERGIAAAVAWMRQALAPPEDLWIEPTSQIWPFKEWATLTAMLAGFASLLPLGLLLLQSGPFRVLQGPAGGTYACTGREYLKYAAVNGLLMWLYLPLIFALFGLHVYLVPIDGLFPMIMVNGTVWWFVLINVIGFFILRRWFKRRQRDSGLAWADLGISFRPHRFALDWGQIGRTALLAALLFAFVYLSEHLLEAIFISDFRFVFPFASDLTAYRFGMWLIYFPFLLLGFTLMGFFLHGQLRRPQKDSWLKTFISWSLYNTLALVAPLILFLLAQYIPLLTVGVVPFVGPGGMLASFVMNLFHIIGVLVIAVPLSTWFYQLTGRPYLGALLNAAIVAWMFTSSQVIAPIPV